MAKYGSASVTITLDDSGGVPRTVTSFVLSMGGLKITNKTQAGMPFGDSWEKTLVTGIRGGAAIALSGLLDDTVNTGTFATMIPTDADAVIGFTRTLAVGVGGGKIYNAEVILVDGSVNPKTGALTEYAATLQPTGVITWT